MVLLWCVWSCVMSLSFKMPRTNLEKKAAQRRAARFRAKEPGSLNAEELELRDSLLNAHSMRSHAHRKALAA